MWKWWFTWRVQCQEDFCGCYSMISDWCQWQLKSEFLWVTCSKPQWFIAFTTITASSLKNFQFCLLKTGSLYVAQAELEFLIFLPQSSECCHQRHTWLEHHHFHLSPENNEPKPIKGLYDPSTSKQQGRTQIKAILTYRFFLRTPEMIHIIKMPQRWWSQVKVGGWLPKNQKC